MDEDLAEFFKIVGSEVDTEHKKCIPEICPMHVMIDDMWFSLATDMLAKYPNLSMISTGKFSFRCPVCKMIKRIEFRYPINVIR